MSTLFRPIFGLPRAANPPARSAWDWLIVAVLAGLALLDGFTGSDEAWRLFRAGIALAVAGVLPWRRAHPLAVAWFVTGLMGAASLFVLLADAGPSIPTGGALAYLVAAYALLRWGSGTEATKGLLALVPTIALMAAVNPPEGLVGWLFTGAFWMFPAALGFAVRSSADVREGRIQAARQRERENLARDLHDTVAHHVSAIAIQAQAARAVAATRPDAAAEALRIIETAASGALSEMRTIVEALRDGTESATGPQPRLADIYTLVGSDHGGPRIEVDVPTELGDLAPQVEAALYRLAQESVANARRHARGARRIEVRVESDDDRVRLTVADDGDPRSARTTNAGGYGLVGMKERATLLGGVFSAGPGAERGWLVRAELPIRGRAP